MEFTVQPSLAVLHPKDHVIHMFGVGCQSDDRIGFLIQWMQNRKAWLDSEFQKPFAPRQIAEAENDLITEIDTANS